MRYIINKLQKGCHVRPSCSPQPQFADFIIFTLTQTAYGAFYSHSPASSGSSRIPAHFCTHLSPRAATGFVETISGHLLKGAFLSGSHFLASVKNADLNAQTTKREPKSLGSFFDYQSVTIHFQAFVLLLFKRNR